MLDRSAHNIKKNTHSLVVASKEIGLKVNADKTKHLKSKSRCKDV